ncbi:cohesin domain-containing protein [Paenibacillus sp. N3.4]|uniref:cohesin domain-containing protein n=1 Tax=Paenibacillus sp. N3.4 TaxID=2603222 RepID=UPI0011CA4AB0|nr:cohesin domain-containing protein [Paenibacillus sp. N3.4]TXK80327.1 hypothetical protein FU659_18560 [Paenibacillus sp. N3.4]
MIRIHRLLSYILIASLLLFSLLPQFASANPNSASFSLEVINDKPISVGDEIKVEVKGINLTDVFAYEVNLDFDPSLLEYQIKSASASMYGFSVPVIDGLTDGHFQFAFSKVGPVPGVNGDQSLFTLTFIAKESGTASIEMKDVKLVDSQLNATVPVQTAVVKKSINIAKSVKTLASAITSITAPLKDGTVLTLPSVPEGFTLAIKSSSNAAVISNDGTIVPPILETMVDLVLEVTRTADGAKASSPSISVVVPAKSTTQSTTASDIAKAITTITAPAKDGTVLTLPKVPEGFTLAIKSSSNTTVIATDGTIVPPIIETTVDLVLEVTRTSDGTKASSSSISVVVPAKSVVESTQAADIAKAITSIKEPVKDGTVLTLPMVPEGFTIAIKSSSNATVIKTDGMIVPPSVATTVDLVLEVTRTSDNTKASTVSIQVKVPAKSYNGGSGTETGNGSSGSNNTPSTDKDGNHIVTLGEMNTPAENGKVIIPVLGAVKQLTLPYNTAQLLGQNQLEIKTDKLTLDIPVDLIKQLTSGLSAEALKDSTISLKFDPLSASEAKALITKEQGVSQADIKLFGEIYEFKLSVTNADGSSAAVLTKFDQPITIH